jgi:flagellar motor switch protein FliG
MSTVHDTAAPQPQELLRTARSLLRLLQVQNRYFTDRVEQALKALEKSSADTSPARVLSEAIRASDLPVEREMLGWLAENEPELARAVEAQIVRFEELVDMDDPSVQQVLRNVDVKDMALALKGASKEASSKVLLNMSERASGLLRKDMEALGAVRERDVAAAQRRIEELMRSLEASGAVRIPRHR